MQRHRFGRKARAACGQNVGDVDDLERLDQPDEDDGRRDRRDRGPGDVAEDLEPARPVKPGRLELIARLVLDRGEQHDEHERRPLPGVADQHHEPRRPGLVRPGPRAEAERRAQRRERPLLHVGEHPEHVGDADRRHHQRNEEHDPKEAASADRLRAEKRKPEADRELRRDAEEDVEASRQQRALIGLLRQRREQRQHEPGRKRDGNEPPNEAKHGEFRPDIADEPIKDGRGVDGEGDPAGRLDRLHRADEMILLRAEQQALVVVEADEGQREAAARQREAAKREIDGNDQREDRKAEEDDHRRQHHDAAGMAVDPFVAGLARLNFGRRCLS